MRGPRFWGGAAWTGLLLVLLLYVTASRKEAGTSRALLIGIQSYAQLGEGWWNLDGPANDLVLLRGVLIDRLGFQEKNITVLADRQATRAAIVQAFDRLIRETRPGDRVYIHYSGHGSSVEDRNGDEGTRRKDSTLVPVDGWGNGAYQILDDEIAVWLDHLLEKTSDVVLVVDACHSGTISRGAQSLKVRGVSLPDTRDYAWSDSLKGALEWAHGRDLTRTHFVRVSACRDDEEAHEYEAPDGKIYGLFTWAWCEALARSGDNATFADLFQTVEARLFREKGTYQEPQLEGARDQFLFPTHASRGAPSGTRLAVLRKQGDQIVFRGGLLSGVTKGSVYARVLPTTGPDSRVEIVSVRVDEATAKPVNGDPPAEGDLFAEVLHQNAFPPFKVLVQADPETKSWARELEQLVSASPRARPVVGKEIPDLVLALRPGSAAKTSCFMLDAGEAPWGGGRIDPKLLETSISNENDLRRVRRNLDRLLDNETLLRIGDAYQDSMPRVEVKLVRLVPRKGTEKRAALTCVRPEPSRDPCPDCWARIPLAIGTRKDEEVRLPDRTLISFWVRNRTPSPVYAYVANLLPSGQVTSLPAPGGEPAFVIPPLDSMALETASRELDDPGLVDTYLCFVTDDPVPLWSLEMGPLVTDAEQDLASRGAEKENALQELLDLAQMKTRGGSASAAGAILAVRRFSVLVGM